MLSDSFTKNNLDTYLKELAKEFRRLNGKEIPAEIILVGGAAILTNYGFREMTTDIDAVIRAASSMKDAVNYVRDKFNLPNGWLNADFMRTGSYSPKLVEYSVYYKTFYGVLAVRTVTAEFLVAMKLRSARRYKNDLSDIIGILAEHEKRGEALTMSAIDAAVCKLYGDWDSIPEYAISFIKNAIESGNYEKVYNSVKEEEQSTKDILLQFEEDYPKVVKESNVNDILKNLREKRKTV